MPESWESPTYRIVRESPGAVRIESLLTEQSRLLEGQAADRLWDCIRLLRQATEFSDALKSLI